MAFTMQCDAKYGMCRRHVSVCVSVCLSVTLQYCIKMAKRRIMQIVPHNSSGALVFWCQRSRQNSNWITSYVGDICKWNGLKLAFFDEKRAITRKRYKIDALFLLKLNRKSYALYRTVMLPMTFGDP